VELARREGIQGFDAAAAAVLLQLPRREIMARLNHRIEGFARCGIQRIDEWADQFRLERRTTLPRAAVILSIPEHLWKQPPLQDYCSDLLSLFERRITNSVSRGPLARMTLAKTAPRVDLTELATARVRALPLLNHILERSERDIALDPAAFTENETLERRLRTLVSRTDMMRRETGINGLYMGYPFALIQPQAQDVKPRISPVLLWPIRIGAEVGARATFTVAFDREREEVRLNPALQNLFAPENRERWEAARDSILSGTGNAVAVIDELAALATSVRRGELSRLPGPDTKVPQGSVEIVSAAVLFHVTFVGQAIIEDLRQMRTIPLTGTALETTLRITDVAPQSQATLNPRDVLDRYMSAESDPSQDTAVASARHPPGLVIEGPPGTGKSQTIVNMVADAIGRKRTMLIVCQKQAALDVVYKRLQKEGLSDRIVMVKDLSRDRRPIIEAVRTQVASVLGANGRQNAWQRTRQSVLERIVRLENQLNLHHQEMQLVDDLSGRSYRELLSQLIALDDATQPIDASKVRSFALGDARRASELCH
jgi:primosomal replication protein N''